MNSTKKPSVSILMPIYNGATYLEQSIGSILAQTFANWELIALDDGSTDNSYDAVRRLAQEDKRIHLYAKDNDGEGYVARNIALMCKWAKGKYAFYMSQDDTISPDCLDKLYTRAIETDADIVLPDMLLKYADNSLGTLTCSYPPGKDHSLVLAPKEAFLLSTDFSINGFGLIRMPLMADDRNDTRFFDSDEYNSRMQFLRANKTAFANGTFYYYQGNPDAVTKRFAMRRFQRLQTGMMLHDEFCKVFDDKPHRLILMTELMRIYLGSTMLLYMHHAEMSHTERDKAKQMFKQFERHVCFHGYKRQIYKRLNTYERCFALCYYTFGTTLHTGWIYRLMHSVRTH